MEEKRKIKIYMLCVIYQFASDDDFIFLNKVIIANINLTTLKIQDYMLIRMVNKFTQPSKIH